MKQYKTVLVDFDGTLLDTKVMQQYVAIQKQFKRFSPEWQKARKEYTGPKVEGEDFDD